MSSLEKCLFRSLAHFLIRSLIFLELSCMSCLYIFEINSWSVTLFAIIFSNSEGCLFTLLIVSFVVQKLLSLLGPICLFLLLFPIFWEVGHKGSYCDLCQRGFRLCFPIGEQCGDSLKKLEIELPYDLAIPLLGIHTEETRIERDTCTPMFIAVLFTIART